MLKDDQLIGTIGIYRQEVRPFTEKQIELVTNFAAQAVIAIENTRLLNELRQRTGDLTESLEQQTAISDMLSVIADSPGDVKAVFDSVAERAARICKAQIAGILIVKTRKLSVGAASWDDRPIGETYTLDRSSVMGRSVLRQQIIHLGDASERGRTSYPNSVGKLALRYGHRTVTSCTAAA